MDGAASVEFLAGGRVLLKSPVQATMVGEYEFVEPDRVLMVFQDGSPPADYRVRVQGDDLRLCKVDEPAKCYDLRRAGPDDGMGVDTAVSMDTTTVSPDTTVPLDSMP